MNSLRKRNFLPSALFNSTEIHGKSLKKTTSRTTSKLKFNKVPRISTTRKFKSLKTTKSSKLNAKLPFN